MGCTFARLMREMRSADLFDSPGISNGERPARSEYTVAANDQTSDSMLPGVSSISTSGADHGMDMPTDSAFCDSLRVDAMPKSESTGCP